MNARDAWRGGFRILARHPWLALLPLTWDLIQMGLAFLGVPLGPVADIARMIDHDYRWWFLPLPFQQPDGFGFTAFLPGFLPGAGDLKVPVQPDSLAVPAGLSTAALLASLLLVPALEAIFRGGYLGLLGTAATGSPVSLRAGMGRAGRAFPGLLALAMLTRLGLMLLPVPLLVVATIAIWLFLPLLPLGLGAQGLPLLTALGDAPGQLWGRFGAWFGLAVRTGLTTGAFTLLWSLAGRPAWVALLVYPFLSTALVAAAATLYLEPPAEAAGELEPGPVRAWWWVLPAAGAGALAGALLLGQWAGFRATREANFSGPFPVHIVRTVPEGPHEWVIYRNSNEQIGIARFARNRWGWKLLWKEEWPVEKDTAYPATVRVTQPESTPGDPTGGRMIIWGEIHDERVALLELAGGRMGLSGSQGPVFFVPVPDGAEHQPVRVLDAQGNPIPPRGVKP